MKREIEILAPLLMPKEFAVRALSRFGKPDVSRINDTYYKSEIVGDFDPDPAGRLRKCLRLRQKGESDAVLTFKDDHFDAHGNWIYSDEHEVQISKASDARALLARLSFSVLVEIDCEKLKYHDGPYEIVLEDVAGLGAFVEVEYEGEAEESEVLTIKEGIRAYLRDLGISVGEELNAGKPELMLRRKKMISS